MDGNQDNQDTIAPLNLMKSVKIKQDDSHQLKLVADLPNHFARAAGIFKYLRESTDELTFYTETEGPSDYQIKCEYCGQEVLPSLNEICIYRSKELLVFCCEQWKQLYRQLLKMRNLWEEKSVDITAADDNSAPGELVYRRKDKLSMFLMDSTKEDDAETRLFEDYLIEMPVLDNVSPGSNVMSFQLSYPPKGSWVRLPGNQSERRAHFPDANHNQIEFSVSNCDHKPHHFGLCHYQDGSGCVNRYYADGLKFLLVLDDGSAQVFYPSGLLAILVIVTKAHGRVCIVYDDAPGQPMRALFQSDGRGTCYHTNGNIWLIINKYGGQCMNPEGARIRRWTWHKLGSTPLKPIFLFINKSIGVRVLGEQQVFVSFLANSKQAKFNVAACCQGNCKDVQHPSQFAKEELLALASEIKTKLLFQKSHFMSTPSRPFLPNAALSPHLHLLKLLKAGEKLLMSEDDRDFLQSCLNEFLHEH